MEELTRSLSFPNKKKKRTSPYNLEFTSDSDQTPIRRPASTKRGVHLVQLKINSDIIHSHDGDFMSDFNHLYPVP